MKIGHTFLVFLCLIINDVAIAEEVEWRTNIRLDSGENLFLHWVGVYEGRNTVYKIVLGDREFHLGRLNAAGQPLLDEQKRYIALPYCADDGCLPVINIFDIKTWRLLSPIKLVSDGQFYITCRWSKGNLNVSVDHGPFQGKSAIDHYIIRITPDGITLLE